LRDSSAFAPHVAESGSKPPLGWRKENIKAVRKGGFLR